MLHESDENRHTKWKTNLKEKSKYGNQTIFSFACFLCSQWLEGIQSRRTIPKGKFTQQDRVRQNVSGQIEAKSTVTKRAVSSWGWGLVLGVVVPGEVGVF